MKSRYHKAGVGLIVLAAAMVAGLAPPALAADADALYQRHCAECHGANRLGGIGPALLPENLVRLNKPQAAKIIAEGGAATRMPGFADSLTEDQVASLVELVFTPLPSVPDWTMADIERSLVRPTPPETLPDRPAYAADPLNLFVVVESGDHHVTILDGDRFEAIARFPSRHALHGGAKFSPDGRYTYLMSRDGWVSKYDLYGLTVVAEVRAGINARNIAISHDGRVIAVANYLPHTLVLLDARDLTPLKVVAATDERGTATSRVSAVYQAAPRASFVVALKDIAELWEMSYAADPPATYSGLVHSYEQGMEEALPAATGSFPIRRTLLDQPIDDFFFTPGYEALVGSARDGNGAVVVNLDVRRAIAALPLPGLPHLGSGISWLRGGRRLMATPNIKQGRVSIIDLKDWRLVKTIATAGPGFFLRSHENSRYAWVDCSLGAEPDQIQLIDKETLEIAATLRPAPGKPANHVEFTRDGRYALVSVATMDGAVVVYDAETLKEVKRLPMSKPSGKYNVFNKIHLSDGTSH